MGATRVSSARMGPRVHHYLARAARQRQGEGGCAHTHTHTHTQNPNTNWSRSTSNSSPKSIRVTKLRRMRWERHVARTGELQNAYTSQKN